MSVISLLNEQLKNNLNKTTKELIISVSEKFNMPYENLLNIWNKINPEFKHNFELTKIVIEDEEIIVNHKIVIEDEEIIVKPKKQLLIED
jgi:hypothetical protein